MTGFRAFLLAIIGIPVFIILVWFIVLPESVIKTGIEDAISNQGESNLNPSINGLRKGLFFTVYADSLELKIDKQSAFTITDISCRINPLYLFKKQFAFSVKGKIGTGSIEGVFKLPDIGNLKMDKAEFSAISYLSSAGLRGKGLISANFNLKNNTIDITFEIPNAEIQSVTTEILLPITSFRKIQGALQFQGSTIKLKSINLEADKGYARLKGDIARGTMNLTLELMPIAGKLGQIESMLISNYRVSPGYYVIPIKKPLL